MLMIFYLVICVLQTGVCNPCDTADHPIKDDFAWGANGHPLNQEAYWDNIDSQMAVLRTIGLKYYRVDMAHDGEGVLNSLGAARFFRLQESAARNNITLIPVIFPPEAGMLYGLDTTTAYERGLAIGKGFAYNYGRYFSYYELGNENDGDILKQPVRDGSDSAHYDMARLRILASVLKGMSDGVKQEDSDALVIISNAGWMHYAYFQLLEHEGVRFDIIGYHWYQDLEHLREVLISLDVYFPGKPVWFTEVNAWNDQTGYSYNYQKVRVKQYIDIIRRKGKNVKGLFIYELFDEPAHALANERSYGLISWKEPYKTFSYKPLALMLKALLERIAR